MELADDSKQPIAARKDGLSEGVALTALPERTIILKGETVDGGSAGEVILRVAAIHTKVEE